MSFPDFFYKATHYNPFQCQVELGEAAFTSRIIRVPTGGGKTEAAVLPWLWKTVTEAETAPKRLIVFSPGYSGWHGRSSAQCRTEPGIRDEPLPMARGPVDGFGHMECGINFTNAALNPPLIGGGLIEANRRPT